MPWRAPMDPHRGSVSKEKGGGGGGFESSLPLISPLNDIINLFSIMNMIVFFKTLNSDV
jgi:hypothetical protein